MKIKKGIPKCLPVWFSGVLCITEPSLINRLFESFSSLAAAHTRQRRPRVHSEHTLYLLVTKPRALNFYDQNW